MRQHRRHLKRAEREPRSLRLGTGGRLGRLVGLLRLLRRPRVGRLGHGLQRRRRCTSRRPLGREEVPQDVLEQHVQLRRVGALQLAELAGVPLPAGAAGAHLGGTSLVPLLRDPAHAVRAKAVECLGVVLRNTARGPAASIRPRSRLESFLPRRPFKHATNPSIPKVL